MSARDELFELGTEYPHTLPAETVKDILDAYRAEILREAHDAIRKDLADLGDCDPWAHGMSYRQGMDWAARVVDRLAEESQA